MILTFPWPPKELSPNARVHWAKKARAAKKYKNDCMWACRAARAKPENQGYVFCRIRIWFSPPDNRLRDLDNCIAAFKSGQDGMAEGLNVNDRIFLADYHFAKPVKHGEVLVEFIDDRAIKPAKAAA